MNVPSFPTKEVCTKLGTVQTVVVTVVSERLLELNGIEGAQGIPRHWASMHIVRHRPWY